MRTSSPDLWTCTRAPSSFHSSDAAGDSRHRVVDVVGRLREHRRERLEQRDREARRPSSPFVIAGAATAAMPPATIAARRTSRDRQSGGARDRLDHQALERALAQLAEQQPRRGTTAPRRSPRRATPPSSRLRSATEPRPAVAPIAVSAASTSRKRQRRRVGGHVRVAHRGSAHSRCPCAPAASRRRDRRRRCRSRPGASVRSSAAISRDLRPPSGHLADARRRVDDFRQQRHANVSGRSTDGTACRRPPPAG